MEKHDQIGYWVRTFFSLYACLLTGNLLLKDQTIRASICGALFVSLGATLLVYLLERWKRKRGNKGPTDTE